LAGVPHVPGWLHTKQRLNHDPLEFIQADLVAPAIVELRCARGKSYAEFTPMVFAPRFSGL
jgi:hypothetical protein